MKQIPWAEIGPHELWEQVVILWTDVMDGPRYPIREILAWIETAPGGRYHLHGWNSTEGFCFRFEDPADATHFKLRWL
jgi:hypothetical protein